MVRLDKGDEVVKSLMDFVTREGIRLASVSGLGAVTDAVLGLFDVHDKKYYSQEFKEVYEVTSFVGNISTMKGEPYLHLHMNIADGEQKAHGGHVNRATIAVTGEIFVHVLDGAIDRAYSEEIGINLIKF